MLLINFANEFCRIACPQFIIRDRFCYHRPRSYHAAASNCNAFQYKAVSANPCSLSNDNRRGLIIFVAVYTVFVSYRMMVRIRNRTVDAYQNIIFYRYGGTAADRSIADADLISDYQLCTGLQPDLRARPSSSCRIRFPRTPYRQVFTALKFRVFLQTQMNPSVYSRILPDGHSVPVKRDSIQMFSDCSPESAHMSSKFRQYRIESII